MAEGNKGGNKRRNFIGRNRRRMKDRERENKDKKVEIRTE